VRASRSVSVEANAHQLPRGNLSVRALVDVVSKEDVLQDSEYLETLLIAVPKYAHYPGFGKC
jgi:hypothetical protein